MQLVEGDATIDDVQTFVDQLAEIGARHDCVIQAFDARYVAGRRHLEAAVDRARQAFELDDAIADEFAVEILCYAAGRRQINQALEMGVSPGTMPVVVLIDGENDTAAVPEVEALVERRETLGIERSPDRIQSYFAITGSELEATEATLEDLVIERVALLVIEK